MKQNKNQNGPVVEDAIDRLMEARVSQTPPPGNVFRTTLAEIRQTELRQPTTASGRSTWWPRLVIGGLMAGGLLALSLVVLSTVVLVNKNEDQKGVSASWPNQPVTSSSVSAVAATGQPAVTSQPVATSAHQSAMAASEPGSNTPLQPATSAVYPSVAASPANLGLPTPVAASLTTAASLQAGYMSGTVVSYDFDPRFAQNHYSGR